MQNRSSPKRYINPRLFYHQNEHHTFQHYAFLYLLHVSAVCVGHHQVGSQQMEVYTGGGGLSYPFKTLKCRADIACTEACSYTTTTSPRRLLLCADACHRSWHEIATGWMVQGSNPGGRARFSASVQTGPGTHLASSTEGTGSVSRGYSGRGVALTTHLHLAPRLKKE